MFEFMIFDLHDTLKDGGVIFTIGVNFRLDSEISLSLVHVSLNIDDFFEYREDITFCILY